MLRALEPLVTGPEPVGDPDRSFVGDGRTAVNRWAARFGTLTGRAVVLHPAQMGHLDGQGGITPNHHIAIPGGDVAGAR